MGAEGVAWGRDFLTWCLQQPSIPPDKFAALRPDFLVVSPPKTGSSWLAANLRCHPQLFVPAIKEVKYFSSYLRWLDLDWYLEHFRPGAGRVKGEASPSYAILPVRRIRLVRRLLPDVKLIFLMREPVARAWSHARHNYRFREANFASGPAAFEDVGDDAWRENFTHPWPLAGGDYLAQLRRWSSVFPREQLYVGFYESIAHEPQRLLRDLFAFLGVDPDVDFSRFRLAEIVLPGLAGELSPALERSLHQVYNERTRELASFLRRTFDLRLPPEWQATLDRAGRACANGAGSCPTAVPRRELDDHSLSRLLEREALVAGPRLVLEGYRGYNLVFHGGRFAALDQAVDWARLGEMGEDELRHQESCGNCFVAPWLAEVKARVDQHVFARAQARLRALEQGLGAAVDALRRVESDGVEALRNGLRKVEADVARLQPWYLEAWRRFRGALRRLAP